ncbi:DUF4392 domain-containing protein [Thermococcus thioreducens]|uniref:D-glutamate cyclase-like C-terminal domain-containing protein n=1 Tax=Thermococcus thioreducens TaxID=277988 RepID=A0A0Q2QRT7_9EURY|nr:glutamate cyclase domain-containing protein [Thermococcus thioreducens]ASJ12066.1 hypothetical protein A3L14_03850 [Thermococcus thioreducens]KQH82717.1 hypothetical protein AMR53_03715 [Thermococcus thioreducens]SEW09029.1 protein of unknown function [Thermococcus thioreducens]
MIAHVVNTDVGDRGVLRVYLDYRRENPNFLHNSARMFLDNYGRVLIITGFPIPPTMRAETDGPPGTIAIAKAVEALGGRAEILTYPEVREALEPFRLSFTNRPEIEDYSLLIALETPGRARDGKCYSMSGLEITREAFDWAVLKAKELGIPTIGIGDGGNEAGMGNIHGLVVRHIPHGEKIASVVETDELILSAVSNWGAYGLVAQASIELGRKLLPDWDERTIVRIISKLGLIDGVSKAQTPTVDGISLDVHEGIVELLNALVDEALR